MPRYEGYGLRKPAYDYYDPAVESRGIPLSDIRGIPLPEQGVEPWTRGYGPPRRAVDMRNGSYGQRHPSADFGSEQEEYNRTLMDRELMSLEEMGIKMDESDDVRISQDRQAQIVEEIQRLMAEQQVYSKQMAEREAHALRTLAPRNRPQAQPYRGLPPVLAPKRAGTSKPGFDELPFGKAFRAARSAGLKVFPWRGKQYTTELR